jgi:HEAT repeat protein
MLVLGIAGAIVLWSRWRESGPAPTETASPAAPGRSAPANPDSLQVVLRDGGSSERLAFTQELVDREDIPVADRTGMVLAALDREVNRPSKGLLPPGSYLPLTDLARLQYLRMILQLGPDAAAEIRGSRGGATGAAAEWRTLAHGATGDPAAVEPLRELLRRSNSGTVRMSAAHFLGFTGDRAAIPDLEAALSDGFRATTIPDRLDGERTSFYPVRAKAATALGRLGVAVTQKGDSYTVARR